MSASRHHFNLSALADALEEVAAAAPAGPAAAAAAAPAVVVTLANYEREAQRQLGPPEPDVLKAVFAYSPGQQSLEYVLVAASPSNDWLDLVIFGSPEEVAANSRGGQLEVRLCMARCVAPGWSNLTATLSRATSALLGHTFPEPEYAVQVVLPFVGVPPLALWTLKFPLAGYAYKCGPGCRANSRSAYMLRFGSVAGGPPAVLHQQSVEAVVSELRAVQAAEDTRRAGAQRNGVWWGREPHYPLPEAYDVPKLLSTGADLLRMETETAEVVVACDIRSQTCMPVAAYPVSLLTHADAERGAQRMVATGPRRGASTILTLIPCRLRIPRRFADISRFHLEFRVDWRSAASLDGGPTATWTIRGPFRHMGRRFVALEPARAVPFEDYLRVVAPLGEDAVLRAPHSRQMAWQAVRPPHRGLSRASRRARLRASQQRPSRRRTIHPWSGRT